MLCLCVCYVCIFCVCMCACTCVSVCVVLGIHIRLRSFYLFGCVVYVSCVHMETLEVLGFFLDCSSLYFLRQDLSLNLGLTNLARLSCQHTPEIQLFLHIWLESQLYVILPGFFHGCWGFRLRSVLVWQTLHQLSRLSSFTLSV